MSLTITFTRRATQTYPPQDRVAVLGDTTLFAVDPDTDGEPWGVPSLVDEDNVTYFRANPSELADVDTSFATFNSLQEFAAEFFFDASRDEVVSQGEAVVHKVMASFVQLPSDSGVVNPGVQAHMAFDFERIVKDGRSDEFAAYVEKMHSDSLAKIWTDFAANTIKANRRNGLVVLM